MRTVTLLPSVTEMVYALGVAPVGVSHECDYPPAANETPAVVHSTVDADADSGAIDDQVQAAESGAGVYEVDVELLDDLDPDVVVTQGICEVCAVDELLVADAVESIDADPEVVTTDPHSLDDVLADVRTIGRAIEREWRAAELVADLRGRIEAVRGRGAALDPRDRPRVAVLDWTNPPMVAGHWVPEMVEIAGGEYGLADPGARSRPREWDEIRAYDPEMLVVAPCGFDIAQTRENLGDLLDRPGWAELTAVRNDEVYVFDGNHYLNRPGPRVVDSLEHLAGLILDGDPPPRDVARPLSALTATDAGR